MDYLYEYLTFLLKTATVVAGFIIMVATVVGVSVRRQQGERGYLDITWLNDRLRGYRHALQHAVLGRRQTRKQHRLDAKRRKSERQSTRPRTYVLDFEGDLHASKVDDLRREITAVLTLAGDGDEVLVRVESPGGVVPGYGLAASQLARFREHGIRLVVAVDKIAASGGYLMASVANRIIAAPFAVLGSIGVIAQIPNLHRLLKKHDVDMEVHTAGQYKRTLTVLGENTDEGRQKFREELNDTHALFKEFVHTYRPAVDVDKVATGETWYGERAVAENLIDELKTSDEYLAAACAERDVYEVCWREPKRPLERALGQISEAATTWVANVFGITGRER